MASSGLKKMLDLIILYTLKSVSENVYLLILFLDAKINVFVFVMACNMPRQMLLPIGCGRCYNHQYYYFLFRQMLLPLGCGRC